MKPNSHLLFISSPLRLLVSAGLISALSACGGSSTTTSADTNASPAQVSTATVTFNLTTPPNGTATGNAGASDADIPVVAAHPTFHLAPVILNEPADVDAVNPSASARLTPSRQAIPREFQGLSSRGLTLSKMQEVRAMQGISAPRITAEGVTPQASTSAATTYTPAQIRAAYGLPALPSSFTGLTATQAAQLGAGQTIYIVDAQHDPNAAAELAAFNSKFGLPSCTTKTIATSAALPLPAASTTACEFSVVYSTPAGGMTSTAPAYDSGWATEIALDVQWAHATAPLARIVLIESADSSNTGLIGGITLANKMGPGVVSMSFGAPEGSWTASVDSTFSNTQMTYVAATGDNGAAVGWPSVSAKVLAVGGTTLTYTGGTRSESAWSGTGGGVSAYTATPSYQTSAVPGMGTPAHRTVADVSFNADPTTGQYLAVISQGSSSVGWLSAGGTSLATPQWAGIMAVANALRAQTSKAMLGAPHTVLYQQIATVPGSYASSFADITKGTDGSCSTCTAKTGYDFLTGLGTPNASSLLSALSGATISNPPVVTSTTVNGAVGTALTFTVSATSSNPLTYALSGAPSGMTINATTGVVTWATPVAGSYSVTIKATDSKTGLSASAVDSIVITAPQPPVVKATAINGQAGTPLSFTVSVTSVNPVTYKLTGAPSGMTISSAGVVTWPTPVASVFSMTVTATDSKTGLSGSGVFNLTILPAPGPYGGVISGNAGVPLSFSAVFKSSDPITYTLSSAPSGMSVNASGQVTWAAPLAGVYNIYVNAKDTKTNVTTNTAYTVAIAAVGTPAVAGGNISGKVGTPLTFTATATAPNPVTFSLPSVPDPTLTINPATGVVSWPSPMPGTYPIAVVAKDNKTGLTGQGMYTLTIGASAPGGGVVTYTGLTGSAGKTVTGTISITDPGATAIGVGISGLPLGLNMTPVPGLVFNLSWPNAVKGTYNVTVVVNDNLGRSTTTVVPIVVQ
jgi:hypothetical protein